MLSVQNYGNLVNDRALIVGAETYIAGTPRTGYARLTYVEENLSLRVMGQDDYM